MTTKIEKRYISIAQNVSGRDLQVPLYRISDNIPGPKVYIQSSIHGSEVQGNGVIYHLIQELKQRTLYGEIILVPNCNPMGTNTKTGEYTFGRFDPVNGANWNRGYFYDQNVVLEFAQTITPEESVDSIKERFRQIWRQCIIKKLTAPWGTSLAEHLNLRLQQQAYDADIVLDLHTGPVATRHIYIPEYAKKAAHQFSIPFCIFIPNEFAGALDEACFCPWWTLQNQLENTHSRSVSFDIEAFTVELGSQETLNIQQSKIDTQSILSYLAAKGVINATQSMPKQINRYGVALKDYKTLYSDFGGLVDYHAKLGKPISKGQTMAKILNVDHIHSETALSTLRAPCELIPILRFPSASVISGTQLYKCFTNFYELS